MGIFDSLKTFGKGLIQEDEFGKSKLGLFGDQMLDVNDGGNRYESAMAPSRAAAQRQKSQEAQQAQMQALYAQGQELGLSPQELFALKASPEAFSRAYAERQNRAPQVVGGGSSVLQGDGSFKTAPMVGFSEGRGYAATPESIRETGRLGASYGEQTNRTKAEQDAAHAQAQLAEMIRNNRANNSVAQGNLGVRQQEYRARQAQGGFGTPGVGGAPGAKVYSDDEVDY